MSDQMRDRIQQEKKAADAETERRYNEVAAKETAQADAFARAAELETEMVAMKTQHVEEVQKAANDATTSAKRSAHFENTIKTKDFEAQNTVLEGRVESLTAQLAGTVEENANLKQQMTEAMSKVQQVALGALETKNANDQISTLQATLQSIGGGAGNSNGKRS
jgi:hypothetical protein